MKPKSMFPEKAGEILLFVACCHLVHAQETPPSEDGSLLGELDALVITGEKIDRAYKDTTASVGLVDAFDLGRTNVGDLNDALRLVANAGDADFIDSGIVLRGINSEGVGGPAGSPLATIYIDGIPQTQNGARRGALGMWDVRQVEVLRGPQSTISGRNALAGAVRILTNDPTFTWEGALKSGFGNQGYYEAAGMVSGPINDRWALRLTAETRHRDGEVSYPNFAGFPRLDERQDDDFYQFRGKLLYQPAGEDGPRALFTLAHAYDSPAYRDVDGPSAGVGYFDRVWGLQSLAVFDEARSTDTTQFSADVSIPLNDAWRIESLSGINRTVTERPSVDLASDGEQEEIEFTQEIRAVYQSDTLEALAGVFYLNSQYEENRQQVRPFGPAVRRLNSAEQDTDNIALFADARWNFSPGWWLLGGMRYDRESQDFASASRNVDLVTGAPSAVTANSTDATFDAFLPKLGLARDVDENHTASFVIQKSYRAGGSAINFVTGTPYDFDPEDAWNYEFSIKGGTEDKRYTYGLNLFYMDWSDQQVNVPQIPGDFTSDIILNAGESTVYGAELEFQARPVDGLRIFSSIGWAHTEFDEFSFVQAGGAVNLAGTAFPQAPEVTAVLGFDYDFENGLFVGADAKYTSSAVSRSALEGLPEDSMPSYITTNARLGWRKDNFTITGWIDNLTDEEFFQYRFDSPGFQVATVGAGRTYGITARYDF